MATKKKGILTKAPEWRKHLRTLKRRFWHRERHAAKQDAIKQTETTNG